MAERGNIWEIKKIKTGRRQRVLANLNCSPLPPVRSLSLSLSPRNERKALTKRKCKMSMSSLYSSASELRRSFCVLPTAERRNVLAASGTPEWNTMQANRNGKKRRT